MYNNEYLCRLQALRNVTNQEIAEHTGISESTVWRIMKGVGKQAYYENVRDICLYLGGSLDEMEGLPPRIVNPDAPAGTPTDPAPVDWRHYIEMKLTLEKRVRSLTIWLIVSVIINLAQTSFVMWLFAYDLTHPEVGWIQYTNLPGDLGGVLRNAVACASRLCVKG